MRPPQPDKRKKKSGGGRDKAGGGRDKAGGGRDKTGGGKAGETTKESQLLRRPSMKKIKAFFDTKISKDTKEEKENKDQSAGKEGKENKDQSKEGKENEFTCDTDLSAAMAKLPKGRRQQKKILCTTKVYIFFLSC